jgi:hypothetical protein
MGTIKHAFVSTKSDGADPTKVQASNWNADHTVTLDKTDVGLDNVDDIQQLPMSYLDTDNTLGGASPSDSKTPSQKAVKEYIDTKAITLQSPNGTVYILTIDNEGRTEWNPVV